MQYLHTAFIMVEQYIYSTGKWHIVYSKKWLHYQIMYIGDM